MTAKPCPLPGCPNPVKPGKTYCSRRCFLIAFKGAPRAKTPAARKREYGPFWTPR